METNSKNLIKSNFWTNLFKPPTEKSDLETVLLSMPPFKNLSSSHLKILMKLIHDRFYSANECIFYQGDPGIGLYIIRKGEIKITRTDESNRQHEIATFSRGDFFGEMALLEDDHRSASAIATKDSNLAVIFKPDLDEFCEKYPKQGVRILRGIATIVATRLRSVNKDYFQLYVDSLEKPKEKKDGKNKKNISTN